MTARPTRRSRARGNAVEVVDEVDLSRTLDLDDLPPLPVRRGVPVEVQAGEHVSRLGLRDGVRFLVACEIAERLPKEERPDWFETDDEILTGTSRRTA